MAWRNNYVSPEIEVLFIHVRISGSLDSENGRKKCEVECESFQDIYLEVFSSSSYQLS